MKIRTKISLWITVAGILVSLIFSLVVFWEMAEQSYFQFDDELKATKFAKHVWYLKKELEKFLENKTEEGV